jgi:LmbE family N-acetylglucosaminyl deacetylase
MKKILVVAPHMDDEVLGVGGTICKHIETGDEVRIIIVANRAYGHLYDPEVIKNEESNCLKACSTLGVEKVSFLRLNDEQLDEKLINVISAIENNLSDYLPDVVYIPYSGDINQDHKAVYSACLVVFRVIGKYCAKTLLCYEAPSSTDANQTMPHERFSPNYYVDIEKYFDKKISAIQAYEKEIRTFPHPRSAEGLKVYSQKRGMEVGMNCAEAFVLLRNVIQ